MGSRRVLVPVSRRALQNAFKNPSRTFQEVRKSRSLYMQPWWPSSYTCNLCHAERCSTTLLHLVSTSFSVLQGCGATILNWEGLHGVGVDGVAEIPPFFFVFLCFLLRFLVKRFFCVFLRFSLILLGQGKRTAIYWENGEFHSNPVCIDPVQNFPIENGGVALQFRKILLSVKFLSASLGPEMAAPILWTPGKSVRSAGKNHVHKIPRFLGGGGYFGFWEEGGSADFIFMGARIYLINSREKAELSQVDLPSLSGTPHGSVVCRLSRALLHCTTEHSALQITVVYQSEVEVSTQCFVHKTHLDPPPFAKCPLTVCKLGAL